MMYLQYWESHIYLNDITKKKNYFLRVNDIVISENELISNHVVRRHLQKKITGDNNVVDNGLIDKVIPTSDWLDKKITYNVSICVRD
jgi:hypothetical protein